MSEDLNQDILDKLTKVCLCKAINRASIKKAIANGADTLEKVQSFMISQRYDTAYKSRGKFSGPKRF